MKEIPILNKKTNQSLLIKVDDDDFEKVNQFKWTLHPKLKFIFNLNKNIFH